MNAVIGSICSRSEVKYGVKKENPFCNNPLDYVLKKDLNENYYQKINIKRDSKINTKEDVLVSEAFELYMLKNFHKIKLNSISEKKLNFWEKDFDNSIKKHFNFLFGRGIFNFIVWRCFFRIISKIFIFYFISSCVSRF